MEVIVEKEISKLQLQVFNPIVKHKVVESTEVLRIEKTDEYTRIDFMYTPSKKYDYGWWVQIDRKTFIRPVGSSTKYYLISAENITYAPTKTYLKGLNSVHCYTLYFPKLPKDTTEIDIIERENTTDDDWFNFYGVSMEKIHSERIVIQNS
jgi:hypothetical protein